MLSVFELLKLDAMKSKSQLSQPNDPSDDGNDYTANYWMLESGPFGVSGFCLDGIEMGSYCYLCDLHNSSMSQSRAHFEGKKHAQKVKSLRQGNKFVSESSTGVDMDDPDNLFLPDRCKVCDVELITAQQQEGHYLSEKHLKKVRNYFLIKIGIREKASRIDPETDEEELKKKGKHEYCQLCKIELSAPVVAQAHYAGKKHAKKLREKAETGKEGEQLLKCDICEISLNSESQLTQHLQSSKHLAKLEKIGLEDIEEAGKSI